MTFLVDAQLPKQLARFLTVAGHDAIHTSDLPLRNATPDAAILELLDAQPRVMVTKDEDFVNSHVLENRPAKLLLISTGNIANATLMSLFDAHLGEIVAAFEWANHVELASEFLIVHD